MLDLETMGNGPDAAITAIGAVYFDIGTGRLGETFYEVVDLESSVDNGGRMDPSTVLWWMRQDGAARRMYEVPGITIREALDLFAAFCRKADEDVEVWGNGAAFDNVILRSTYTRAGHPCPWPFWADRCYRTMRAMLPQIDVERSGTHHNALDDATTQARVLVAAMKKGVVNGTP